MKRFLVLMIIAILMTGMISAQGIRDGNAVDPQARIEQRREVHPEAGRGQRPNFNPERRSEHRPNANPQNRDNDRQRGQNQITISGILKLERGFIAIQNDAPNSDSALYLVPMLNRYIGFINGLREDARVIIEGHQFRNIIHPVKLTIGDRAYNFPAFNPNHNFDSFQNKHHGNFRKNMDRHRPNNNKRNNN
ncbi:MAG: hypothetical protein FWB73_03665 [Treponema sp.]|nr:hypothetical protein [Treponema sp.]